MYQGKRLIPVSHHKKTLWLLVSLALLLTVTVGGTIAFLFQETGELENEFQLEEIATEVVIEDGKVSIKNTGDTRAAYIRAKVVANWIKEDAGDPTAPTATVYGSAPEEGEDYSFTSFNPESKWVEYPADSGTFYYCEPVQANASTAVLLSGLTVLTEAPAGYTLSVEVVAQAIQADGTDSNGNKPVELAWSVDIAGGTVGAATITR
ncbi:MAG: hypothetical protein E7443_06330 [Ruminococcaceae bacterium]|nr:hypothetical protein [Oscillospiraceae bacterium]